MRDWKPRRAGCSTIRSIGTTCSSRCSTSYLNACKPCFRSKTAGLDSSNACSNPTAARLSESNAACRGQRGRRAICALAARSPGTGSLRGADPGDVRAGHRARTIHGRAAQLVQSRSGRVGTRATARQSGVASGQGGGDGGAFRRRFAAGVGVPFRAGRLRLGACARTTSKGVYSAIVRCGCLLGRSRFRS